MNGITADNSDHLWVADVYGKQVNKYLINDDRTLERLAVIPTPRSIDNLQYDSETNTVLGGAIASLSKSNTLKPMLASSAPYNRSDLDLGGAVIRI
ncbi:MAG: hypothetical protein V2I33_22960, partial [Kangiellaceae bacterium]|nr:hypothetical protein [Kangiellaceae bacterium]